MSDTSSSTFQTHTQSPSILAWITTWSSLGFPCCDDGFIVSGRSNAIVVALRGYVNERSEFLTTTLPIALIGSPGNQPITLPHFAIGGGWTTQILLLNPSNSTMTGVVQLLNPRGDV